jgi:hypothetical protein
MRWHLAGLGLLAAVAIQACGRAGLTLDTSGLGLPSASASPMATRQVATSPDGGIYRNPDNVDVLWVGSVDPSPIAARLGTSSSWSVLTPLGPLLGVGLHVRNDGKGGSQPGLDDLQVASDQAPPGTESGPLRSFYHPTFPLAALSDVPLTGDCTVSLDPGQSATVVLLYPPTAAGSHVVWGRYTEFALDLHRGGGLGHLPDGLHVAACKPPRPSGA